MGATGLADLNVGLLDSRERWVDRAESYEDKALSHVCFRLLVIWSAIF